MQEHPQRPPMGGHVPRRPWLNWTLGISLLGLSLASFVLSVRGLRPEVFAIAGAGARSGWPWIVVGGGLLLLSLLFVWRAYRWQPPLGELVQVQRPFKIKLTLEDNSQPGTCIARAEYAGEIQEPLAAWRIRLARPIAGSVGESWDADLFFDPTGGLPIAVRHAGRLISIVPELDAIRIVPALGQGGR